MVNRYITALLVALAATGMEAQTYQQALRFALLDISYDEFIQQPEAKALEENILCAIKAFKEASQEEDCDLHHFISATLRNNSTDILAVSQHHICSYYANKHKRLAHYSSIVIRGPDHF